MQPASERTLPQPPDLSPGGQLALPGAGGQLGLDGRVYGHARPLPGQISVGGPTEGRSPEPILGPNAEFCTQCKTEPATDIGGSLPAGPAQLVLDLGDTTAIPQLDLFARHDLQHAAMCAELGDAGFSSNLAKCGRTRVPNRKGGVVTMYRDDRGTWRHSGVVQCDHWCCAKCGPARARSTAAALGVAIDRWLNGRRNAQGGRRDRPSRLAFRDVWMLTLTLPHRLEDWPGATVEKLYAAHALFLRSPAWRSFCREWGISSAVRVLDNAHGGRNGTHPHFHIALFPSLARERAYPADDAPAHILGWRSLRSLSKDERALACDAIATSLWGAWHDALRAAGVEYPVGAEALKLSPGEKAAGYFTAWGLADEVGATPQKARSHLRLLDAAGAGVEGAGAAFVHWYLSTQGKQWVTGLGDLRARLEITDEDIEAHAAELRAARDAAAAARGEPVVFVKPLQVEIPDALFASALSLGWASVHDVCNRADVEGVPVQLALVDALCAERRRLELLRARSRAGPAP